MNAEQTTLLQVDLGKRQIALHPNRVRDRGLLDCCEALLAHAIGHLLRHPRTPAARARLALLERLVLPFPHPGLLEPFADLLVDVALGRSLREPLLRIHRTAPAASALDRFLLTVREELWQTTRGELLGAEWADFERTYPGCRAQAQLLAQDLQAPAGNVCKQLLHFLWVASRYLPLPDKAVEQTTSSSSLCALGGEPSAGAWAMALTPDRHERAALEQARDAGWISPTLAGRLLGAGGMGQRILALPGADSADATLIPEVMAAYYRRQARRHLAHRPLQPGLAPQALRLEIYLDVSGSLPDPRFGHNPLTLAAQVLATAAVRAGGAVRLVLYSNVPVCAWHWCRSEVELSRVLMHYIGSGTRFPFALLEESIAECGDRQPVRVILSDGDFDTDHDRPGHADVLRAAAAASPRLVLFLHQSDADRLAHYRRVGATVLAAEDGEDYPRLAAELAGALAEEGHHVSV